MNEKQMVVLFEWPGGDCLIPKPRSVDGKELPNWRDGPTMMQYIRQLRMQGWLFAFKTTIGSSGVAYTFTFQGH